MCSHHFIVFLFTPLASFPKAIHAFLGFASIKITNDLTQFFQFLNGLNVSQQLKKIHLCCIQGCSFLFHVYLLFIVLTTAKVRIFFKITAF